MIDIYTDNPAAVVSVVETAAEARDLVAEEKVDMVIFVSAGMYEVASQLQFDFPFFQIYIFAGRPVKGQPFLIPKKLITLVGIERMVRGI